MSYPINSEFEKKRFKSGGPRVISSLWEKIERRAVKVVRKYNVPGVFPVLTWGVRQFLWCGE